MKLIIEDDEGRRTIVPFLGDALNIGRADENQVRLGEKNVSRKHGRILRASWGFVVEDFSTFTGIRVNGERVKGKRQVKEGDLIQISEFDLQLEAGPDDLPKSEQQAQIDGAHAALAAEEDEVTSVPTEAEKEARRHEETAVINLADIAPALRQVETIEIDPAEQPRLVGASGPLRDQEFPLRRSPASIGRALENDVCLDNPQVSRSHCRLALVGGGWKVIDAESRHGVKVNGEPYAASPLHHGDLLEVGPVRLVFAMPGKPVVLPAEPASTVALAPDEQALAPSPRAAVSEPDPIASGSASKLSWIVGAALVLIAAAVLMFGHRKPSARELDVADASLQKAGTSAAAHRYREAVRSLRAAIDAGAPPERTRVLPSMETEARAEEQYEQLVQAISRQDFDAARSLLDQLAAVPTWYGGRAQERSAEVKAGYVKTHVDRANADRARDDSACLTEANLALAVNPQSEAARALAAECGGATAASSPHARAPDRADSMSPSAALSGTPRAAASKKTARASQVSTEDNDAEARRLLHQGVVEATANDLTSALADLERAAKLQPSGPILGSIYRSLGTTNSRAGHADKGAHYYRLYLPYCDNPSEKAQLTKMLADYDRAHR